MNFDMDADLMELVKSSNDMVSQHCRAVFDATTKYFFNCRKSRSYTVSPHKSEMFEFFLGKVSEIVEQKMSEIWTS